MAASSVAFAQGPPTGWSQIADIDLAKPFGARSEWRFVALQGPLEKDPIYSEDDPVPGAIRLCLTQANGPCDAATEIPPPKGFDAMWGAHFLKGASVVHPHGSSAPPLLLVRTGSLFSGDGDQANHTQVFAYRRQADRFERVFDQTTGHNNNEEIRYIETGPLAGGVISAEPTEHLPYRFWITVNRLTAGYAYRQVLKYRSATGYNDGNPLAVIDSEMPNIEHRLGLWRAGQPLPLPAKGCATPRLVKMELWCGPHDPAA